MHPVRSLRVRAERAVRLARTGTVRKLADGTSIDKTVHLPRRSEITAVTCIGPHTEFAGPVSLRGAGGITIGAWCAVGKELTVISSNHTTALPAMHFGIFDILGEAHPDEPEDVRIGHGCWIGDRVTVLPGAVIGSGAVIAAGSIVRGDVSAYEVVAGVPARSIGARCSPEVASALERSKWWTWTPAEMRRRSEFFHLDIRSALVAEIDAAVDRETPHRTQPPQPRAPTR